MLVSLLTGLINTIEILKNKLTIARDRLHYKTYVEGIDSRGVGAIKSISIKRLSIKTINNSMRCDICHQSDQFDSKTEVCNRCRNIQFNQSNVFNPDTYITRKEVINEIIREKENKEQENKEQVRLTLTVEEIKKISVRYEDGIKDALLASVDENWDSSYSFKRRENPYGDQIKSAIRTAVNQLGINPNRAKYINYSHNHAYNDSWLIIDSFDNENSKPFLKLSHNDWLILEILFDSMDNADRKYSYKLFDEESIFEKAIKQEKLLYDYKKISHKNISYGSLRQSLNNLIYNIKCINYYNHEVYNTIYGTNYRNGSYFIINDYGVKLILLKNAIIEMNPLFFQVLYKKMRNN